MAVVQCHCCSVDIYGCTGSLSWPDGRPFVGPPEFHCPHCTEKLLGPNFDGKPCHIQRKK